ncbi:MAG: hypothetical protein HC795_17940 [Coleofasciculaceae cyanobacterium RL_1_1]|jgi:hypothetical protein|nr:hypothetical protein [Coleofasciculaceae cyanobacterium RL_1_1]
MSGWQPAGSGLEAKVTNRGQLMIREAGKYPSNDDYPHFIVSFDSQGNVKDFHSSDSRYGSRFGQNEIVATALAVLRAKGML